MSLDRFPYPDAQTAHDILANHLAVFVAARDVADATGDFHIVDVRPALEFAAGTIPGAIHLPLINTQQAQEQLPHPTLVLFDDGFSSRARQAAVTLAAAGRRAKVLEGGFSAWQRAHLPTVQPTAI